MSFTLFKTTARANWVTGVIILLVMVMYLAIIISMYDFEINEMIELLPEGLANAMGYSEVFTGLTGFIASYYYCFLVIMFPMIYCIIVANALVARYVDRGSMAYLLSTPNTRLKIINTQAVYMLVSVTVLFGIITALGIGISEAMFPGELDIKGFLLLNLGALCAFYSISGISFLSSCIFNETKYTLALGGGIPVLFFVINMLSNVNPDYEWIINFSLFALYRPADIINRDPFTIIAMIVLVLIAAVLYGSAIAIFNRRNLPV
jgi:ABC-2 type transport system permease protein